jgi:hypothetical protein
MSAAPQSFELKLRVFAKQEFHCPLCRCPLNLQAVFNDVGRMPAAAIPAPIRPANGLLNLADRWCVEARVSPEDLRSRNRFPELVALRARFCHAMRDQGYSLQQIGRYLGIHHTSVLHALRKNGGPPGRAAKKLKD